MNEQAPAPPTTRTHEPLAANRQLLIDNLRLSAERLRNAGSGESWPDRRDACVGRCVTTYITGPAIAASLGLSSRGALARIKAAGIPPAACIVGLGRYAQGFHVYGADTLDRLKRAAATSNCKPSTAK